MVEVGEKMNDLSLFKILVTEWTQKAQSGSCTDDEKNVYYECAEKLHEAIQQLEE
jgi:hypothetical protein